MLQSRRMSRQSLRHLRGMNDLRRLRRGSLQFCLAARLGTARLWPNHSLKKPRRKASTRGLPTWRTTRRASSRMSRICSSSPARMARAMLRRRRWAFSNFWKAARCRDCRNCATRCWPWAIRPMNAIARRASGLTDGSRNSAPSASRIGSIAMLITKTPRTPGLRRWSAALHRQHERRCPPPGSVAAPANRAPVPATFDKKHPFQAAVIDNIVLTGRGSTKETRHVELSLADSGLTYQPGDALGVAPRNDPALVAAVLEKLSLSSDSPVKVKQGTTSLGEALAGSYEITAVTPRFVDHWAEITGATELQALRAPDQKEARAAFQHNHHVYDVVSRFPAPGIDAAQFVAGLRPLQPRLYSIASSLAAAPDEAHLTVSTVRYAVARPAANRSRFRLSRGAYRAGCGNSGLYPAQRSLSSSG